jgi:membrane protein
VSGYLVLVSRREQESGRGHADAMPAGPPQPPRIEDSGGRPLPDEAPLPQPERREPRLEDPKLTDLSRRDYVAILTRAGKEARDDGITDLAAALAYYSFMAIPSVLLVAVGVFTLVADASDITALIDRLGSIVPTQTTELLDDSLKRLNNKPSSGIVMTVVGFVLALWATTGAMTAFMRALNRAYDRAETRNFVRVRLIALQMVLVMTVAFLLVFGLLVLGPVLSDWIGSVLGIESVFGWLWWIAQWPVLLVGLLAAFATMLYLGPNVEHPRWHFVTPGSLLAVFVWLGASGLFAVYTSMFDSYNKTWGSLAAVIVMLTWLWLTGLALLFGAEVNAEAERSRELRRGEPAERDLQVPAKG